MKIKLIPLAVLCFVATHCVAGASAAELDQSQFEKLHQQLQPDQSKTWRSIPWKISLLDAQAEAAQSQKPIFIWAMDGHPLGCT